MITKRKEIALVGCGKWGQNILRDLVSLDVDVTVVARSQESINRAREFGAKAIVKSINDLSENISGAVVSVTTINHYRVITQLLEKFSSIPIFCEKPVTVSSVEIKDLLSLAPDRIFVMDKWRYHQGILVLAEIAKSKKLGRVRAIKMKRCGWGYGHKNDVDPVWILMPHDLSIVLEILGEIPTPVSARFEKIGKLITGMSAFLGTDPTVNIEVSIACPKNVREFTLVCDDGVAVLRDSYEDHVSLFRFDQNYPETDVPVEEKIKFVNDMPLLAELRAFLDHIDGKQGLKSNLLEGYKIVKAIEDLRGLSGEKR